MLFDPFGVSAFTACGFLAFFCYRLWQDVAEMKEEVRSLQHGEFQLRVKIQKLEAAKE